MNDEIILNLDTCMKMSFWSKITYPDECCGVLFGKGGGLKIDKAYLINNSLGNGDRRYGYAIDPGDLIKIERVMAGDNSDLVGIFHSHPDAEASLSVEDEENMIPGMAYVILSVTGEKCRDIKVYIKKNPGERASLLTLSYGK